MSVHRKLDRKNKNRSPVLPAPESGTTSRTADGIPIGKLSIPESRPKCKGSANCAHERTVFLCPKNGKMAGINAR